ncbi:3-oxoacyl-[acyl-carrier-protein] synthase III chloroplastic [Bienertia sinuspersici]
MANTYGFSSSAPISLNKRFSPSIRLNGPVFCSYVRISKRVFCSSIEGAEKHAAAGVSVSETKVARLGNRGCKLVGCGSALPKLQISNDDLSKYVETSDEWISTRTGIRKRRVLSGEEGLVGLATEAAKKALEMANVDPDDIDLVLMCTSTPEDLFGSAPQVQRALGCTRSPLAYDITAACSGFLLGLVSAACHVRGGGFQNVLVIGADALSRFVDWTDRGTCILFGDAAGAVVVQACDSEDDSMFAFDLHSDGDGARHLNASLTPDETDTAIGSNGAVTGFPPRRPSYSCINMNGKEVFRFAVRCVPQSIEAALQKAGLNSSDIDWLLLHQEADIGGRVNDEWVFGEYIVMAVVVWLMEENWVANQRIIDAVATRLEVPSEHVLSNLANYGNTSAASIPLALDEAVRSGKVQPGHVIATSGFGAGLTWGSAIIKWG